MPPEQISPSAVIPATTNDRTDFRRPVLLGRTGLSVGRLGIAAGYGAPAAAIEKAFHEHGLNYFYWTTRRPEMRAALQNLKAWRSQWVVAIQSYDHLGWFVRRSVEKALRTLGIEQIDVLMLGCHNSPPRRGLLDKALRLKQEGKFRFLGITSHHRPLFARLAAQADSPFDVFQVRYNAAHRGAEQDVFPYLPSIARPGITTYTATRWGRLLNPKKMPAGEQPLSAAECYRFALSQPAVDLCLIGPRSAEQMEEGLRALAGGPLSAEEAVRVLRIGDFVHG